jgi:hypothetical protein
MGGMLAGIYCIGFFSTYGVLYVRAGFPGGPDWREFLIPNFPWFMLMGLKAMGWPLVLGHWFANGRQGSAWEAVTRADGREVRRIRRPVEYRQ